jgi:hypothetical protein
MTFRRAGLFVLGCLLVSRAAVAETHEQCVRGDCEYRFDDGDVNSPGWSAYSDYLKVRGPVHHAMLIRPRVSYVMELVKSTQSVW